MCLYWLHNLASHHFQSLQIGQQRPLRMTHCNAILMTDTASLSPRHQTILEGDCVEIVPSRRQSYLTASIRKKTTQDNQLLAHTMWTCDFTPNNPDLCSPNFSMCAVDKGHFLAKVESVDALVVRQASSQYRKEPKRT